MKVSIQSFGMHNGINYDEIIISHESKFRISFSDLGARINSWYVPMENNQLKNIILGYENAAQVFTGPNLYYGATIGRVAGRIRKAQFTLDGQTYLLSQNENENHLHGGDNSIDLQKWDYTIRKFSDHIEIVFEYRDAEGTNGYPGNVDLQVTHSIYHTNKWVIQYSAKTDETTLLNLTNHAYFNLNGDNQQDIKNHIIQIDADDYLPVDQENLPTGESETVEGTPFDLRKGKKFGDLLLSDHPQFSLHQGFDHPFLLNDRIHQVVIKNTRNAYKLSMSTEEPALVVHTHNDRSHLISKTGSLYDRYAGIALEAQKEPDAINHRQFHSILLNPDEHYQSETIFSLEKATD